MKINLLSPILLFLIFYSSMNAQQLPILTENQRVRQLEPPKGKVRMVLDTDTYNEIDDQFALVYAILSSDKLDIEAVYAAPFLNHKVNSAGEGMAKSYEEILRILKKMDVTPDGFVFKGSSDFIRDVKKPEESPAALDLIKKAKLSSPHDPLYVVAIGAITNVSNAILLDTSIIRNIVVVWLGGNAHSWPQQREFNFYQDIPASRTIFDCGVPLVQLPCTPVVTHLTTTVPEMERAVGGRGSIGDYLLKIFKEFQEDHFAWSKVLWDMAAISYVINPENTPSNLEHSPIVNDECTFSFDPSRHLIRVAYFVHRDPIFRDFFTKIEKSKFSN